VFRGSISNLAYFTTAGERSTSHFGITPLHVAVWNSQKRLIQFFLDVGADPEARMPNGWTPLCLALISRNDKIVRTISWYLPDLHSHLVDAEKQLGENFAAKSDRPDCGLGER
jgi:ankyrin repeat protein